MQYVSREGPQPPAFTVIFNCYGIVGTVPVRYRYYDYTHCVQYLCLPVVRGFLTRTIIVENMRAKKSHLIRGTLREEPFIARFVYGTVVLQSPKIKKPPCSHIMKGFHNNGRSMTALLCRQPTTTEKNPQRPKHTNASKRDFVF